MTESKRTAEQAELTADVAEVKRVGELTPIMYKPPPVVDMPLRRFQSTDCAVHMCIVKPNAEFLVHSLHVCIEYNARYSAWQTAGGAFVNARRLGDYLDKYKGVEHDGWISVRWESGWRVTPTVLENASFQALCNRAEELQRMVSVVNVVPSLQGLAAAKALPLMGPLGISALKHLCGPEHLAEAIMRAGRDWWGTTDLNNPSLVIERKFTRLAELMCKDEYRREEFAERLRRRTPENGFASVIAELRDAKLRCDQLASE